MPSLKQLKSITEALNNYNDAIDNFHAGNPSALDNADDYAAEAGLLANNSSITHDKRERIEYLRNKR